jgi:hypothetical protein
MLPPFFLAGSIAAAAASGTTLAGLTLGAPFAPTAAAHPDMRPLPRSNGSLWSWRRPEGGTIDVYTDTSGIVTSIAFTADDGEIGTVDLPCVRGEFPIQDSHVNLDFAIDPKDCESGPFGTYELRDHSILEATFLGPGDGQLHEVQWYRPARSS